MFLVHSRNNVPIRLTEERWQHVLRRHPEMVDQLERALETVAKPEMIREGDFGELLAARLYDETPLTRKFLVVVYREVASDDGFVLTAHLTSRLSARRRTIWKR